MKFIFQPTSVLILLIGTCMCSEVNNYECKSDGTTHSATDAWCKMNYNHNSLCPNGCTLVNLRSKSSVLPNSSGSASNSQNAFNGCYDKLKICTGVYEGSGRCVCGSDIRNLFDSYVRGVDNWQTDDSCQDILLIGRNVCGSEIRKLFESYIRGPGRWSCDDSCKDYSRSAIRKPTIAAMIEENNSLSTLTKLVKASNLSDTLDQDGSYTIFAPNNDAFARVPDNVINWWLKPENSDELKSILLRHVWPTIYLAKVIKQEDLDVETVGGDMIRTERSNDGIIVNSYGSKGEIVATDTVASNGVIHVIDNVLWLHRTKNILPQDCENDVLCLPEDINVDDLEFRPTSLDGLVVSPLKGNPFTEPALFAAKFAPGLKNPLHVHTYQYEAAIWKGQFKHYIPDVDENDSDLEVFNVGDTYSIPAGQVHQDIVESETDPVILLIYFHGPFDVTPI